MAEDFRFSEHHRVESADDSAEVAGGFGFFLAVEMGSHAGVELDFLGQPGFDESEGRPCVFGGEVKLGAIASGNDHALGGFGQRDQLVRCLAEFRGAHGKALPHLHGGGAVIEAEAKNFHQTKAKTTSESTNKTTAESEKRRPVNPRTCLIPSSTP